MTLEECAQKIMKRLTHKPYQRQPLMVFMRNGSVSREEALRVIADEIRAAVAAEREACEKAVWDAPGVKRKDIACAAIRARGQAESGSGT